MSKIATWGEVNTIAGETVNPSLSQCPTYSQLSSSGKVSITGSYVSNQLVLIRHISKAKKSKRIYCDVSYPQLDYAQVHFFTNESLGCTVSIDCTYYIHNRIIGSGSFMIYGSGKSSVDNVPIPLTGDFSVVVDSYEPKQDSEGNPIHA